MPLSTPGEEEMKQRGRVNTEPSLTELLSDPICRLVMARDSLKFEDVRAEMLLARQRRRGSNAVRRWLRFEPVSAAKNVLCRLPPLCGGLLPFASTAIGLLLLIIFFR